MTRKRFLALFIFIFLLAACQSDSLASTSYGISNDSDGGGFYAGEEAAAAEPVGAALDRAYDDGLKTDVTNTGFNEVQQQQESQDRLIIRTGNVDIVVADPEADLVEIGRLAENLGGWVVTSEVRQSYNDSKTGTITLRVPADEYDRLVNEVKEMAIDVTWESSSSQDVTEEYVDLNARLGNLEATADRVRAFLDDADTVEEALAVNQELSRLDEEIERIKGRMQYLSQSAAFSTLTVSLTPDTISQPIEVAGWRPEGTAKDAIEGLVRTLQSIADFGIVLALYFLPLALLVGIPGYILFRAARKWYRNRRNEPETAVATD